MRLLRSKKFVMAGAVVCSLVIGAGVAQAATPHRLTGFNLTPIWRAYVSGDKAGMDQAIANLQTQLDASIDTRNAGTATSTTVKTTVTTMKPVTPTTMKPVTPTTVKATTPTTAKPVTTSTTAKPVTSTTLPSTGTGDFAAVFGSRPASGVMNCNGQSNVTISGKTFKGIGNDVPAITISNCTNVVIKDNDFIDDAEPIYVVNSKNVQISFNRYQNITGPHTRNGSNRGNFTQWVSSTDGFISNNEGIGGDTEDIISIYKSGGSSASSPLIIENNHFEGTNWTSSSGSGMMLGDGGGSHIVVRNNVLLNPGQVGIGVAGGSDIHVTGNTIMGEKRTSSNIALYVWAQGASCSSVEVANNTVDWVNAAGTNNPQWDGGGCGTVTGFSTNKTTTLSAASLAVKL